MGLKYVNWQDEASYWRSRNTRREYELDTPVPTGLVRLAVHTSSKTGTTMSWVPAYRERVRESIKWAWHEYKSGSENFRRDSTSALTGKPTKDWCGLGVFALDALDTLYLVGLQDEVKEVGTALRQRGAKNWLQESSNEEHSTFEMTIRVLGGLMGAFTVSNDDIFLDYAETFGTRLLDAWGKDRASVLPSGKVNPRTGEVSRHADNIAEAGTLQVEFSALAHASGKPFFAEPAIRTVQYLMSESQRVNHALAPPDINPLGHLPLSGSFSVGARADSYFEYLLKLKLQRGEIGSGSGDSNGQGSLGNTWVEAMDEMLDRLIRVSPKSGGWYAIHSWDNPKRSNFEHLTCFVPGMLSLGLESPETAGMIKSDRRLLWETAAEELTWSCCALSDSTASGLPFDNVDIVGSGPLRPAKEGIDYGAATAAAQAEKRRLRALGEKEVREELSGSYDHTGGYSLLRPELVESLFYMYTRTRDVGYLYAGRRLFDSIVRYSKQPHGFSETKQLNSKYPKKTGHWESWVLAETFKYFYLLFSDPQTDTVSIAGKDIVVGKLTQNYVFTTEAHLVPKWKQGEN